MRIAVPYFNGYVFQHFGRSEKFIIYTVTDGTSQIVDSAVVETGGRSHGQLAEWLQEQNVDAVICGGIGQGMQQLLTQAGIRYYGGVTGECDRAVRDFLAGDLLYLENPSCAHDQKNDQAGHDRQNKGGGDGSFHMPILF